MCFQNDLFYICFLSLQVNKTIKSNREIINGFLILFEYIKLKIGKEERKNDKTKKENQSSLVATVTTS